MIGQRLYLHRDRSDIPPQTSCALFTCPPEPVYTPLSCRHEEAVHRHTGGNRQVPPRNKDLSAIICFKIMRISVDYMG